VEFEKQPVPSIYNQWPKLYKYTSNFLFFKQDLQVVDRQTYSALDWLGDVGGLFDALRWMAQLTVSPFAAFALNTKLLGSMFMLVPEKDDA